MISVAAFRLPAGERLDAFVLRMTLAADGEPRRCTLTHVRTGTEQVWAGWVPDELASFIEKHSGLRAGPAPATESPPSEHRPAAVARRSRDYLVVLDAGKAIGGVSRDIDLVVTDTRAAGTDFGYRATLAARRLGAAGTGEDWADLASQAGTGRAARQLALRFPAVQLPAGIHRLQLRMAVTLPAAARQPPALALA